MPLLYTPPPPVLAVAPRPLHLNQVSRVKAIEPKFVALPKSTYWLLPLNVRPNEPCPKAVPWQRVDKKRRAQPTRHNFIMFEAMYECITWHSEKGKWLKCNLAAIFWSERRVRVSYGFAAQL